MKEIGSWRPCDEANEKSKWPNVLASYRVIIDGLHKQNSTMD